MKNKIKAWWYRNTNFQKKIEIDTSLYDGDFELMKRYALDNPTGGRDIFIYIGDNKFIYSSNAGSKYWIHTINNVKNRKRDGLKKDRWFNMQWFIHLGNKQEISIQGASGWPGSFGYEVGWGGDYDLSIRFWLGVKWYFSIKRLPKWYMNWFKKRLPRYEYSRTMEISFHNGAVWWNFWTSPDNWSSETPWWRRGSFNPIDKLKGKSKHTIEYFGHKTSRLYFKEGGYDVVSIKERRRNKYKRFGFLFNQEFIRFETIAGKFVVVNSIDDLDTYKNVLIKSETDSTARDIEDRDCSVDEIREINKDTGMIKMDTGREVHWSNIYKIIKENPVPVPGKGTMSYNCGEDARYSSGGPAKNFNDAFGKFHSGVMEDRERYGSGHNWLPEKNRAA